MFAEQTLTNQAQPNGSEVVWFTRTNMLVYQAITMVLLSLIAFLVNHFYYKYPGNVYLSPEFFLAGIDLLLIYGGFLLLRGRNGKLTQIVKELTYYFLIVGLVVFVSNAAQYTPFPTIDQHILKLEFLLNIDTGAMINWAHAKPWLNTVLNCAYNSLSYQLCVIPVIVILAGRTNLIREFYFLLMTAVLTGFTFYYFFPTTAPASVINSDYFSESQRATYLKFFQLHHYIQPVTMDGGLIALPSFHVIWAWLCLYLVRGWPVLFNVLLPINVLLMASCVLLGWHYCMDILGSVVVILFAHGLYGLMRAREERLGAKNYISSFASA